MLLVVLKDWRDRHERDGMLVEQLHQLGKVRQRPGQPVHLIYDYDIDLAGADFGQEFPQGGTFQ